MAAAAAGAGATAAAKAAAAAAAAAAAKPVLGLAVLGHVDAGKTTLIGRLMFECGATRYRTMDELTKAHGDGFGWGGGTGRALVNMVENNRYRGDRERGITVHVRGPKFFDTPRFRCYAWNAPGHTDFALNMASCVSQSDVAVVVIDAQPGCYEASMDEGGALRQHILLAYTLGIKQLIVCVNKMDDKAVMWSERRYNQIVTDISRYATKCGFVCPPLPVPLDAASVAAAIAAVDAKAVPAPPGGASAAAAGAAAPVTRPRMLTPPIAAGAAAPIRAPNVTFVPCSAWAGTNLKVPPPTAAGVAGAIREARWYGGMTLLQAIDMCQAAQELKTFDAASRAPLRVSLRTVYKIGGIGSVGVGRVLSGTVYEQSTAPTKPVGVTDDGKAGPEPQQQQQQADNSSNKGIPAPGPTPGRVTMATTALTTARRHVMVSGVAPKPENYDGTDMRVWSIEEYHQPRPYATVGQTVGLHFKPWNYNTAPRRLRGLVMGDERFDPPQYCSSFIAQVIVMKQPHAIHRGFTCTVQAHQARATVEWTRFIRLIDRKTGAIIHPPPFMTRAEQRKARAEQNADLKTAHPPLKAPEYHPPEDPVPPGGPALAPAAPAPAAGASAGAAAGGKPKPSTIPSAAFDRSGAADEWAPQQLFTGQAAWVEFTPLSFVSRKRRERLKALSAFRYNNPDGAAQSSRAIAAHRRAVGLTADDGTDDPDDGKMPLKKKDTRGTLKKPSNRRAGVGGNGVIVVEPFALYPSMGRLAFMGAGAYGAHVLTAVGVVKAVQRCDHDGNPTQFVCGWRDWLSFIGHSAGAGSGIDQSAAAQARGGGGGGAHVSLRRRGVDVLPLELLRMVFLYMAGSVASEPF